MRRVGRSQIHPSNPMVRLVIVARKESQEKKEPLRRQNKKLTKKTKAGTAGFIVYTYRTAGSNMPQSKGTVHNTKILRLRSAFDDTDFEESSSGTEAYCLLQPFDCIE